MSQLPTAVGLATKDLGVRVRVSPALGSRKVDLCVSGRSARWTLERLALVFDGDWIQVGDDVVLAPNAKLANQKQDLLVEIDRIKRFQLTSQLKSLARVGARPWPEIEEAAERAYAEIERLEREKPDGWERARDDVYIAREGEMAAHHDPSAYFTGVVLALLSPSQLQSVLDGTPWLASTLPGFQSTLPLQSSQWLEQMSSDTTLDPMISNDLMCVIWIEGSKGLARTLYESGSSVRNLGSYADTLHPGAIEKPLAYLKSLDAFRGQAHTRTSRIEFKPTGPMPTTQWYGNQLSSGDALTWLAKTSNIDHVGQAIRTPVSLRATSGSKVGEWTTTFELENGGWLRLEDGAVLYRPQGAIELEVNDIPESTWSMIEGQEKPGFDPDLKAYARFLGGLNDKQFVSLSRSFLSTVNPSPLREARRTLSLLASISNANWDAINIGTPILRSSLESTGQSRFNAGVAESTFWTCTDLKSYLKAARSTPQDLAVHLTQVSQLRVDREMSPGVTVSTPVSQLGPLAPNPTSKNVEVTIRFGYSAQASFSTTFNLRRPPN